jgi:hypothetical protein
MSRLEEELDKDAVCHHFYSTYIVNKLHRKLFKVLETSITMVRFADDLVLLAKE